MGKIKTKADLLRHWRSLKRNGNDRKKRKELISRIINVNKRNVEVLVDEEPSTTFLLVEIDEEFFLNEYFDQIDLSPVCCCNLSLKRSCQNGLHLRKVDSLLGSIN